MKLTYFSAACAVGIILLWGIGAEYFFPEKGQPGAGYSFVLISTQTTLNFLGVILVLIFSSLQVTSESSAGTLQMVLVCPVKRTHFYVSKLLTGWVFSVLLLAVMTGTALFVSGLSFGYGDFTEGGIILFRKSRIFIDMAFCYGLVLVPLLAYCSFGLLVSVLAKNTGTSIGISVGGVLFLDLARERLGLSPYLFQSYIEKPFELVQSITEGFAVVWKPEIYRILGISLIWALCCAAIGLLVFKRKDYKN